MFSTIAFLIIASVSQSKDLAPVLRHAQLEYQIFKDQYSTPTNPDDFGGACQSSSMQIAKGTMTVPVYDMREGGGVQSSSIEINTDVENALTYQSQPISLELRGLVTYLKMREFGDRKFFASELHVKNSKTGKSPLATAPISLYTKDLKLGSVESWVGSLSPELEDCDHEGFSAFISFVDEQE